MITKQYISSLLGIPADEIEWTPSKPINWPDYDRDYYEFFSEVWRVVEQSQPAFYPDSLLPGYFEANDVESSFIYINRVYSYLKWDERMTT